MYFKSALFMAVALTGCRSTQSSAPPPVASTATPNTQSTPATGSALAPSVASTPIPSDRFTPASLPGASGGIGFDDLTFAPRLHRVLAPAGRTGKLDLIDPVSREAIGIDGFATAEEHARGHEQGTTSADEGGDFIFAIDRTTKRLDVVDPKQRKIVAAVPLGGSPDYVRWVEPTREVWVTEPDNDRIEVFTVAGTPPKPSHAAFIKVDGGPESLVIDNKRQRAFTHLWKASSLAIDLRSRSIIATWKNGCSGSRGIALDESRGFLFAGCSEGKAFTIDVDHDGKQIGSTATGNGVDVIAYSPSLKHLYVPGASSATMAILDVKDTGELATLATLPTANGAHCVAADNQGGVWVCDPEKGRLLYWKDTAGASHSAEAKPSPPGWSFDSDRAEGPPAGFSFGRTGSGKSGQWFVRGTPDAPSAPNVLAQVDADSTDYRFPIAVVNEPSLRDVRLSVRCKPVSGKVDQACGLVFRYRNQDNYYVTRANALEDNVRLYHVVKGERRQFAGWNGKVSSGAWHSLRVDAKGDHFEVYWDDNKVIDAHDGTFADAGKVGVWTKADSVTYFDNLTAAPN